jgi:hypothetical protein
MFAMGPRYTYSPAWSAHSMGKMAIFGEGLFGGKHGFNTVFPSSRGALGAASSFAMQLGGGVDLRFARHLGVRAVEADYVRSTLPNGAANTQNDLRLAGGVVFHFDSK